MQSYTNIFFSLVCLVVLTSTGFAQVTATSPQQPSSADTSEAAVPDFPYIAQITGDDVYVRSGPGTNHYPCGKLSKTDTVTVVDTQFSWSCIIPPPGSFSWISKQYVRLDPANPAKGIVTGDSIRVWAGSADGNPIHSRTMQFKLNKEDQVRLLVGQEQGDYYKIAPPLNAYLWVSTQYTRPIATVGPDSEITESKDIPPAVVPTDVSIEARKLAEYYLMARQIKIEQAKPASKQNYELIKKMLLEIANNKAAGKATRYSKFAVEQIKRFELAVNAEKTVKLQDDQLQKIKQRIDKDHAAKIEKVPNLGDFAVIGKFQTSSIYSADPQLIHYLVVDDSGRILCYALPQGQAAKMNLNNLIGRKVGLLGTIEPHPQTASALVKFTKIQKLK